jgi:hypothetical protein
MTEQQIISRFIYDVVRDERRHTHYKRTVERAEFYTKLATGEKLETLLKKFARRESDQLFNQRVEITQHVAPAVIKNILDVFQKVPRSNYRRILAYQADTTKSPNEIEGVLKAFWGEKTLDDWCATRLLEMNTTDPNAWVVAEFSDFNAQAGERAQPYPFEVDSTDALDFLIERGKLKYLIARAKVPLMPDDPTTKKKKRTEPWDRYTLYLADRSISLTEVELEGLNIAENEIVETQLGKFVQFKKKLYRIDEHLPHKLGFVPALRVGYYRDLATKGETFLPPYAAAIPYLVKSLKINSEFDLTTALVAFPLTIRYAEPCKASGCMDGILADGKTTCGSCGGTGKERPTSSAEEIVISLPRHATDFIDLEKLVAFKAPPVEILKFQQDLLESLTHTAKAVVFNSDLFDKKQVADTATGKNIDLQNVYDALYGFARHFADSWEFFVKACAEITDLQKGLIAQIVIPRDFKLKTRDQLMAELKEAHDSGAGPAVRMGIERDLVRALTIDSPDEYTRWQVKERFNPFSGAGEAELVTLLQSDLVPKSRKVLYANFNQIFDDLEMEYAAKGKDLYALEVKALRIAIDAQVNKLLLELMPSAPSLVADADNIGKVPLAIQQLALARQRAIETNDAATAASIGAKINELLNKVA